MRSAWEIDRLLGLLKWRLGRLPHRSGVDCSRRGRHRRRRRALLHGVGPEGADLHGHKVRRRPAQRDIGQQLALEHRARKQRPALGHLQTDDVGDQGTVEARGEGRRKISRLIGVGEHHMSRGGGGHQPRRSLHEGVRCVARQRLVLHGDDLGHLRLGQFGRRGRHPLPQHRHFNGDALAGQLLGGRHGLPAGAIQLVVPLFRNDENHSTRASSRSRRTSSAAASAGEPPIITVCFAFCGT